MIKLNNVSKKYGDFKAVDNISFEIYDGEIFGFLGPNGAGKSSTIKMMTGINSITSGEILIDGKSIKDEAKACKGNIGFVSDNVDVMLNLSGIEYLNLIVNIFKIDFEVAKKRIYDLASRFDMLDALNDKIESYSHGMRQKIAVIGVLLHSPKNWILDEPLTGLDPKSAHTLKEMMKEHARNNNTVLFSTHVLEVAENLCDRIGIINHGKIIFLGTLDKLKKEYPTSSLEEIFLILTKEND